MLSKQHKCRTSKPAINHDTAASQKFLIIPTINFFLWNTAVYFFEHHTSFCKRKLIQIIQGCFLHNASRPVFHCCLVADLILFRLIQRHKTFAISSISKTFPFYHNATRSRRDNKDDDTMPFIFFESYHLLERNTICKLLCYIAFQLIQTFITILE